MLTSSNTLLALDVGKVRVGVATANAVARIPHPLITLDNDDQLFPKLEDVCRQESVAVVVVGLPRNLNGDYTDQTHYVEEFVKQLKQAIDLPVYWQDEALTSVKAERELAQRGKGYAKGDIDALAATYILDDFLRDHPEIHA